MSIIMLATLHDHAPNTYYGQWPGEKPLFPGLESPSIAHHELVASAGFVTFDVPERDFPRESLAAALEICVSTTKKNQRARRSGALPATTTPLTASIQSNSVASCRTAGIRPLMIHEAGGTPALRQD